MEEKPISFQTPVVTRMVQKYSGSDRKLIGSLIRFSCWRSMFTLPFSVESMDITKPETMTQDRKCGR
ncbi:hypothetical protein D3C80_1548490 [compost metagenome]